MSNKTPEPTRRQSLQILSGPAVIRTLPLNSSPLAEAIESTDQLTDLISIMKGGSETSRTSEPWAQFAMPFIAGRLSDEEAADVSGFAPGNWGNQGLSITDIRVDQIRKSAL